MSYADKVFVENAKMILEHGTTTEGQINRPHWADGTMAYTIKNFGVVNRYDLRKEFPAITLRRTAIKSAFDEVLWIYQRKSNNIKDLKPHIWDEWADENGSIGKAYGYQIGKKFCTKKQKSDEVETRYFMDQIDAVLYDLKHTPFSRRIMTSIWNFEDLHDMRLQPCCWNCTFNVTDEGGDKLVLNMILNQRSNDFLAANNWNVVQYALLQMMIAQCCNMEAGELVHVIADQHIYDRHVDIVKELVTRHQYEAPSVELNPDITDFYKFTTDDVTVTNYEFGPQVEIEIAI